MTKLKVVKLLFLAIFHILGFVNIIFKIKRFEQVLYSGDLNIVLV